jgi:hypothetical protein
MTSARKACLIRFLLWSILAFAFKNYSQQFSQEEFLGSQEEFLGILALFEAIIAISPFLDDKKPKQ